MGIQKKKEMKKKKRLQRAKSRVLARRKRIREELREEKRRAAIAHKFREKETPIVNDPEKRQQMEDARKERVVERLKHNHEILAALEKQYDEEMAAKESLNKELEEKGLNSLREKLDHVGKEAENKVQQNAVGLRDRIGFKEPKRKKGMRFGGSAEVVHKGKNTDEANDT